LLPLPWLVYSIYRGIAATVSVEGCVRYLYAKGGRFLSPVDSDNIGVGAWLKLPTFECYLTAVFADTLFFSLLLLLSMIVLVIIVIACFKWKMTKGLGVVMVVLYFIFLAQDLLRNETIAPGIAKNVFGWTRF
jgi:Ca2+/Na+ antiporter